MSAQMTNLPLYNNSARIKRAFPHLLLTSGFILIAVTTCWSQQVAYNNPPGEKTKERRTITRRPADPTVEASKTSNSSLNAEYNKLQKRKDYLSHYLLTVNPTSKDYEVTQLAIRDLDAKIKLLTGATS